MAKQFQRIRKLEIIDPCSNSWDEMNGNDRERFCASCHKTVHDLSKLTNREVEALFLNSRESICGRITRRPDGDIETLDSKRRRPATRRLQIVFSALLTSLFGVNLTANANPLPLNNQAAMIATEDSRVDTGGPAISGTVYDLTHAVIVGAKIVIKDKYSLTEIRTTADIDGKFYASLPKNGSYLLKVFADGFQIYQAEFQVGTSQKLKVDPILAVDLTSDIVVITAPITYTITTTIGVISCNYTRKTKVLNAIKMPFKKLAKVLSK